MSTAENHYISRVHLKGYKSIIDTEITLKKGLNILIGKNGSGKTNFLEFLGSVLNLDDDFSSKNKFFTTIELSDNDVWELEIGDLKYEKEENLLTRIAEERVANSDETKVEFSRIYFQDNKIVFGDRRQALTFVKKIRPIVFVIYNRPINLNGFDEYLSISFQRSGNLVTTLPNTQVFFIRKFIFDNIKIQTLGEIIENKKYQEKLASYFKISEKIVSQLRQYSIVQGLRIKEGVSFSLKEHSFEINFLMFEFLVNDQWLLWKQLSDGTKRIFYLISEVASVDKGTILLEEPELGTHPDQLHKIMTFLKEQSKEKQIIMTTHAPQTLNILGDDELDRIIITKYDSKKGTKMHHLSGEKINKAQAYMDEEGLWLSDFWMHADLETEEI